MLQFVCQLASWFRLYLKVLIIATWGCWVYLGSANLSAKFVWSFANWISNLTFEDLHGLYRGSTRINSRGVACTTGGHGTVHRAAGSMWDGSSHACFPPQGCSSWTGVLGNSDVGVRIFPGTCYTDYVLLFLIETILLMDHSGLRFCAVPYLQWCMLVTLYNRITYWPHLASEVVDL